MIMPIGDPMGGEVGVLDKGKLTRVWISSVPVSNLDDALEFYGDVLGLSVQLDSRENNWIELGREEPHEKLALYVPSIHDKRQPGGDTGIVFETDDIYELHRRLVDEGVEFKLKPQRQRWGGLMAIFLDPDGNELTVVEDPEHYTRTNPTPR
jgi:catechol 2,3-dioxygenase-like lactoylglutathione lyase family enzyme